MSEEPKPNILDFKFLEEESYCSLCKEHLRYGPVLLLQDGKSVCGHCVLEKYGKVESFDDIPAYRNLPLENILAKFSFPCRFKERGCTECIPFDRIYDHDEFECTYNTVACPALPAGSCPWKGSLAKMVDHYFDNHNDADDYNGYDVKFKLEVDKDSEGIILTTRGNTHYFVKYGYHAKEGTLKYDIRHCNRQYGYELVSKLRLMNDSNTDCTIGVKASKSVPYDSTLDNMQKAAVLNLRKYLPSLDDPDCISVTMDLEIEEY